MSYRERRTRKGHQGKTPARLAQLRRRDARWCVRWGIPAEDAPLWDRWPGDIPPGYLIGGRLEATTWPRTGAEPAFAPFARHHPPGRTMADRPGVYLTKEALSAAMDQAWKGP